ncbi:MAG TPA: hypothetical protein VHM30_12755, partial [Gemmatimonadaceae bacterium]|nr:hypothetical protein [Gemmatimonadaceae bacterium]
MGVPLSRQPFIVLPADEVRAWFARRMLGDGEAPERLHDVVLWPHQREAVVRIGDALEEFGGALLADDVGLGKTFVALAVAARYADPLVVAPAALRSVWTDAAHRAAMAIRFCSIEWLSRGGVLPARPGILVVDEAHHARNPATKRYAALARLAIGVPVFL